jgi:proteasome lid subunit RPN8/RPN11
MEIFSIHPVTTPGVEGLPAPEVPYYALAHEGLFLHRKTQIGNVLVKQPSMPKNALLAKIGYEHGFFQWTGEKIPGRIIAQATDFFRRVYREHKTEAEVIITMHNETGEFRLFVPYQRVSGMGVKSIYEPTHIDRDYTVVGTLHSHCNFSAFHSGTDSADAADMDGVHFTIGMLERETPEIVAMVVMNKKEFHYDTPETVAEIAFDGETAPPWWDDYVFPSTTSADKPRRMRTITQDEWNIFRGTTPTSHLKPNTTVPQPIKNYDYRTANRSFGWYDEDEQWGNYPYGNSFGGYKPSQPTNDSKKFNKRMKRAARPNVDSATDTAIDKAIDLAILEGVIRPEDWTTMEAGQLDDINMWRQFYLDKLDGICDILEMVGMGVEYSAQETIL